MTKKVRVHKSWQSSGNVAVAMSFGFCQLLPSSPRHFARQLPQTAREKDASIAKSIIVGWQHTC
jgi:hypothetical protein